MKKIISFIFLFLYLIIFQIGNSFIKVDAATYYSDVLDDLRLDHNFNPSDYQSLTYEECLNKKIELLKIIQIAENGADELYLYVYEPTASSLEIKATAISMSVEYTNNPDNLKNIEIYNLKLVSSYGVFNKYVVVDFERNDEAYRYYNIVTIYREFIEDIDEPILGTDEGNEIGIHVGQQWCCYFYNDKLYYEMGTFNTLLININHTGCFEYLNGLTLGSLLLNNNKGGLSWFICFDAENYVIKHIYDADLSYKERSSSITYGIDREPTYGKWSDDIPVTLTDNDIVSFNGEGLFSKKYTWNRISTGEDFLSNVKKQKVKITEECEEKLKNSQWVFAFTETNIQSINYDGFVTINSTDIDKVTVLRIKFLDVNNKIYNLGVVSDRVNPDNESDGLGFGRFDFNSLMELLEKILSIILFIALLFILIVFVPGFIYIINIIFSILKFILKIIISIFTLPFNLLKSKRKYK